MNLVIWMHGNYHEECNKPPGCGGYDMLGVLIYIRVGYLIMGDHQFFDMPTTRKEREAIKTTFTEMVGDYVFWQVEIVVEFDNNVGHVGVLRVIHLWQSVLSGDIGCGICDMLHAKTTILSAMVAHILKVMLGKILCRYCTISIIGSPSLGCDKPVTGFVRDLPGDWVLCCVPSLKHSSKQSAPTLFSSANQPFAIVTAPALPVGHRDWEVLGDAEERWGVMGGAGDEEEGMGSDGGCWRWWEGIGEDSDDSLSLTYRQTGDEKQACGV
ncbi:hypothetical protein BDN67DRAFT_1054915 [Paxillus ammoniavirescens]|nr:hypothetical protein BDN67DRAFT_1054915 [Paxillus ammoniavirescens]